jgi:superfamily II DNA or RNA helicase
MMDYHAFLQSKTKRFNGEGFECDSSALPPAMFEWQQKIVAWACRKGRAAIWADTGLGKTVMQLAWADQVVRRCGQSVLILTPLAVSSQTVKEAERFGLHATIAHGDSDIAGPSIYVTNYQKLHRFDASVFGGVVLDESSILKSFQGKTKTLLTETFSKTPYRLACTATPAPNDHLELGNHSDFLGIMPQKEMLARWFLNDLMGNMAWRLKAHAVKDFWRWVASWALVLRSPADMGYDSTGYDLPALTIHHVTIPTTGIHVDGMLFADASLSATTLHDVLRQTSPIRARKAAEIVKGLKGESVLLWTHTNYEADEIRKVIKTDEVRGSDSDEHKELMLLGFTDGSVTRLLTKPSLAGFGMNWQACHNMIFVGMDYSHEKFYQAVRRCWRYGQTKPVNAYLLCTDMEWRLFDALAKKQAAHTTMQNEMIAMMKEEYAELTNKG